MSNNSKGLARAKELYQEPGKRAKELKTEGKKMLGYMCMFAPVEIMEAARESQRTGRRIDMKSTFQWPINV